MRSLFSARYVIAFRFGRVLFSFFSFLQTLEGQRQGEERKARADAYKPPRPAEIYEYEYARSRTQRGNHTADYPQHLIHIYNITYVRANCKLSKRVAPTRICDEGRGLYNIMVTVRGNICDKIT